MQRVEEVGLIVGNQDARLDFAREHDAPFSSRMPRNGQGNPPGFRAKPRETARSSNRPLWRCPLADSAVPEPAQESTVDGRQSSVVSRSVGDPRALQPRRVRPISGGMIWFLQKQNARLQYEIRRQADGHEVELVMKIDDGRERVECFRDASAAMARSEQLHARLAADGWRPPVSVETHGSRPRPVATAF